MEHNNEIYKTLYRHMFSNAYEICGLCLSVFRKTKISVVELFTIESPYYSGSLPFHEIIATLGIPAEVCVLKEICKACADSTIKSFLFLKKCQLTHKTISEAIQLLEYSLQEVNSIGVQVKSAFFAVSLENEPAFMSTKNLIEKMPENVCKVAALHFRKILSLRKLKNLNKDQNNVVVCQECGKIIKNKHKIGDHMRQQHSSAEYPCSDCSKVFKIAELLRDHREVIHMPKILPCPACDKKFSTDRTLKVHTRTAHTPRTCKICLLSLPSRNSLLHHMGVHGEHKCPQCSKSLKSKQSLRNHMALCCNTGSSFICDMCSKDFIHKSQLIAHMSTVHGFGNCYTCMWCGKKYKCLSNLKLHEVKHTKVKDFHCALCGGDFVTKAALTYHTRLHTGEKPFKCDMCDMTFISASRRMAHKRRKHLGPHLECGVCKMKFVNRGELNKHQKRHFNPQSKLFMGLPKQ